MKRISLMAGMALAAGALQASSAQASTVTIGQLFAPNNSFTSGTLLQSSVSSGTSYVVPSAGLITSWSFQDASSTVPSLKLKVARPTGTVGNYTIVAESAAGTQTANAVNTYQTAIPVQQGDILGIYCDGSFCMSNAGTGSDVIYATGLDQPPGSTQTFTGVSPERIPVSATLQPAPGINLISPTSGSIKGGTSVTIAGHDFQGTSVSFGGVPAMSLTVNSDSQITAVSPPASKPGPTDIRVTTVAGTSPVVVADRFTYTACVVPKLKGKKLKADKKKLSKADCKLGKVKGPKGKNAKVKKQKPKPGTILAPGSKVKVTTK